MPTLVMKKLIGCCGCAAAPARPCAVTSCTCSIAIATIAAENATFIESSYRGDICRRGLPSRASISPIEENEKRSGCRGPLRDLELRRLRRLLQRDRRRASAADDLGDFIEVPGPHLALMLGRRVAVRLGGELRLLELRVGCHATRP